MNTISPQIYVYKKKTIDLLYIIWQKYEQNGIKIWRDRNYQYIHSNNLIKYNRK